MGVIVSRINTTAHRLGICTALKAVGLCINVVKNDRRHYNFLFFLTMYNFTVIILILLVSILIPERLAVRCYDCVMCLDASQQTKYCDAPYCYILDMRMKKGKCISFC